MELLVLGLFRQFLSSPFDKWCLTESHSEVYAFADFFEETRVRLGFILGPNPPLWALKMKLSLFPLKYSRNWLPHLHLYILTLKTPYFHVFTGSFTSVWHFGHLAIRNPILHVCICIKVIS